MLRPTCLSLAVLLAIGAILNGTYMLVAPVNWYLGVPGVTDTGPFNQHFIRDIGIVYLFLGAAYGIGARRPRYRAVLWGAATLWQCSHALFHFWEVAVGICGPSALVRDFAAVTLPALIGAGLTWWAISDARAARPAT